MSGKIRYRAINKALFEEYGEDAYDFQRFNTNSGPECLICSGEVYHQRRYAYEGSVVEIHEKCENGCFEGSWVNGFTSLQTKGFSAHFAEHPLLKEEDVLKAIEYRRAFEEAIKRNQQARKQLRRLFFRKKRSQRKKVV